MSLKGPANFVSLADKRAEDILYEELSKARPGYGFFGEEGGNRHGGSEEHAARQHRGQPYRLGNQAGTVARSASRVRSISEARF